MSEELCECRVWPGVHVAVSLTQVRAYISHLVTKCMYIPTVLCGCGAALRRSDTDHGMRCPALDAQVTLRHGILKGILRCAVHRAGTASALELPLCRLLGLSAASGTTPDGSAIRAEAGAAASSLDHKKRREYARLESNGYGFPPFSVES
jgi:hypothetical protein